MTYEIIGGNDAQMFRLDEKTGELFLSGHLSKSTSMYHISIAARDGGNQRFVNPLYVCLIMIFCSIIIIVLLLFN